MSTNRSSCCSCTDAKSKPIDTRIRDKFIRTNLDLLLIGIVLAFYHISCVYAEETTHETSTAEATHEESAGGHNGSGQTEEEILHEEEYSVYAVMYPW